MPCLPQQNLFLSFFNVSLANGNPHNSSERLEQLKLGVRNIHEVLSSKMNLLPSQSIQFVYEEVTWLIDLRSKASRVFARFQKELATDPTAEVLTLHQNLVSLCKTVQDKQIEVLADRLCEGEESVDLQVFLDAASLVFSFASENSNWRFEKKMDKLLRIYNSCVDLSLASGDEASFANILEQAEGVLPKEQIKLVIKAGDTRLAVDREKMLAASQFLKKMIEEPFREKGSSLIELREVDANALQHLVKYVDERDKRSFDDLDLEALLRLNACCSRLMVEVSIRKMIVQKVNERVSDLTIGYGQEHGIKISFKHLGEFSKEANTILSDSVVGVETKLLDLRKVHNAASGSISSLLKKCPYINTLCINYETVKNCSEWNFLEEVNSIAHLRFDLEGVQEVNLPAFLDLKNVSVLRSQKKPPLKVHLERAGKLEFESLRGIVDILPSEIVSLDLYASRIVDQQLSLLLKRVDNLEKLNLAFCKSLNGSTFLGTIGDCCPKLSELSLYNSSKVQETALRDFFSKMKHLISLNVGWHNYLSDSTIERLAAACRMLRSVDLTNLNKITDSSIKFLAEKCDKLSRVKLDFCSRLTSQTLAEIRENAPCLRQLSICNLCRPKNPLSVEAVALLMKSRTDSFNLVINKNCPSISSVREMAVNYPLATVTVV